MAALPKYDNAELIISQGGLGAEEGVRGRTDRVHAAPGRSWHVELEVCRTLRVTKSTFYH